MNFVLPLNIWFRVNWVMLKKSMRGPIDHFMPQSPDITERLSGTHSLPSGFHWDVFLGPAGVHTLEGTNLTIGEGGEHLEVKH